MARKQSLDRGNDNYTMLIDIILNLSPKQAEKLYQELKIRYTTRGHTKLYTPEGIEDKEKGLVRLTKHQYSTLRLKYGDSYIKQAILEMEKYIKFLKQHEDVAKYRTKLMDLNSRTHSKELDHGGWVYEKCKGYINVNIEPQMPVNPFLINDISVARKYIESLSEEMRKMPDVIWLLEKFPELRELYE